MLEQSRRFYDLSESIRQFGLVASINLVLMLSLTWGNISESKQIRTMLVFLQNSLGAMLLFMLVVFLDLFGLIMFASFSFGFADDLTADFNEAAVSLFKLFMGHGIAEFYRTTKEIDWVNAHLFIFAFIALLYMFTSIAIVIVSQHYFD